MMPTTPSGTRIFPTWMPVGRNLRSVISPTGSASAATASTPCAIASIVAGVERQPVDERSVLPARARGGDVFGVRGEQLRCVATDRGGDRAQRRVLGRGIARASSRDAARAVRPTAAM